MVERPQPQLLVPERPGLVQRALRRLVLEQRVLAPLQVLVRPLLVRQVQLEQTGLEPQVLPRLQESR